MHHQRVSITRVITSGTSEECYSSFHSTGFPRTLDEWEEAEAKIQKVVDEADRIPRGTSSNDRENAMRRQRGLFCRELAWIKKVLDAIPENVPEEESRRSKLQEKSRELSARLGYTDPFASEQGAFPKVILLSHLNDDTSLT